MDSHTNRLMSPQFSGCKGDSAILASPNYDRPPTAESLSHRIEFAGSLRSQHLLVSTTVERGPNFLLRNSPVARQSNCTQHGVPALPAVEVAGYGPFQQAQCPRFSSRHRRPFREIILSQLRRSGAPVHRVPLGLILSPWQQTGSDRHSRKMLTCRLSSPSCGFAAGPLTILTFARES